ncbi:MAG: anti-sigma factor [Candidatus Methylacidiphilales bacterium]|nr:anti-sigma factor [Candidatus Methylacidiphilales bacterium]
MTTPAAPEDLSPTSNPTPKTDWARPVIFCILMLPILAGGVLLAVFFNMRTLERNRTHNAPKTPAQISLEAENTLLKKMLGQVEGRVAVLGPIEDGGSARGKIVWDESLQQGFVFVAHLPEPPPPQGKAFFLWADDGSGTLLPCARLEPAPDGSIRRAFSPPKRILKAQKFVLTLGDALGQKNMREKTLLQGSLETR